MQLTHKIALCPTPEQVDCFRRTCGTARRGFFITGKYEQLRGSTPYSGLGLALRQLVRQLLARSDAELQSWREAIRTALGASAAMLLPIVPDLALIVGETMPVYEISGMEARHRLERAHARAREVLEGWGRALGVRGESSPTSQPQGSKRDLQAIA